MPTLKTQCCENFFDSHIEPTFFQNLFKIQKVTNNNHTHSSSLSNCVHYEMKSPANNNASYQFDEMPQNFRQFNFVCFQVCLLLDYQVFNFVAASGFYCPHSRLQTIFNIFVTHTERFQDYCTWYHKISNW